MVHNLVRFNLNLVRLGFSENGVDRRSHTTNKSPPLGTYIITSVHEVPI
jgi:hypothetical protein